MQYCSECGRDVSLRVPEGDNLPRYVCDHCNTIHYQNPRIVAGALALHEGRILLCKRAIEPRLGYWTLPAGFMENGETIEEAAARETMEEACAIVRVESLYTVINVPHISQVHMMYLGRLEGPGHRPGPESLETELLLPEEIPWEELAFPSVRFTLESYLEDRHKGEFPLRSTAIRRPAGT
ncbi:MAG: NUDIX hydrolase [Gammaproteobacteria bacterium]|nr:NUDIX hydrolase [Gammaproteobacteria bacterium]